MPTQLIVFCAKKCFAVKAEIITPHNGWDCEVYGIQAVVKIQHVSHFFDIDNIGN